MHIDKLTVHPETFPDESVYPYNLAVLKKTQEILFKKRITFFVGENGSGKSTLLTAIALRAGIHIWQGFARTPYKTNRYKDEFYRSIKLYWRDGIVPGAFFASEIFKNFSLLLDEWASMDPGVLAYFGNKSLVSQSHGQSHMSYFESRFSRKGVYLLDEPENALSPTTQLKLLTTLKNTANDGAQFIIATHSPILLSLEDSQVLTFDTREIQEVQYRDTDHYKVYRDFFGKRSGS